MWIRRYLGNHHVGSHGTINTVVGKVSVASNFQDILANADGSCLDVAKVILDSGSNMDIQVLLSVKGRKAEENQVALSHVIKPLSAPRLKVGIVHHTGAVWGDSRSQLLAGLGGIDRLVQPSSSITAPLGSEVSFSVATPIFAIKAYIRVVAWIASLQEGGC